MFDITHLLLVYKVIPSKMKMIKIITIMKKLFFCLYLENSLTKYSTIEYTQIVVNLHGNIQYPYSQIGYNTLEFSQHSQ